MRFNRYQSLPVIALCAMFLSGCRSSTVYFAPEPRRGIEWMTVECGQPGLLVPRLANVMGMAIGGPRQELYVSQQAGIHALDLKDGQWGRTLATTKSADCLALDESAGRIYWGDNALRHIATCDLQGADLRVLVSGVNYPQVIAVNPRRGLLYWGQEQPGRGVWMARLDGTERRMVSDPNNNASALAVDSRSGRVFWARKALGGTPAQITTADFDGSNPQVIHSAGEHYIEGLAVDERARRIVWIERHGTDPTFRAVIRSAKFDGKSMRTLLEFTDGNFARAMAIGPPRARR